MHELLAGGGNVGIHRWSAGETLRALSLVILTVLASCFGWSQWQERSASAHFYQQEYSPAVVFACTGQMLRVEGNPPAALQDFLSVERSALSCEDVFPLPDDAELSDLNVLQQQTIASNYLFGWLWRIGGIDWIVGGWVAGAFTGLAMLGFALVAGRIAPWPVAFPAAATIFFLDDAFGYQIVHLRDLSKAAFFYLLVFLLVAMFEAERWRKIAAATIAAVVLATAIGFRNDSLLFLYLFVAPLLLSAVIHRDWRWSVFAGTALIAVLFTYRIVIFDPWQAAGTNVFHFYLLGQTFPFVQMMKLDPSPYLVGYFYNDSIMELAVRLAETVRGSEPPILGTNAYDEASRRAVLLMTYQFPADSAVKTLTGFALALFGWMPGGFLAKGAAVIFSTSTILFYWRWRGLVLLFPVACYAAIAFVQYDIRHVFPYQMLGKLLLAAALALPVLHLVTVVLGLNTGRGLQPWQSAGVRQRLAWAAGPLLMAALAIAFIAVMRPWQVDSWRDIRTALDAMPERNTLGPGDLRRASADGRATLPLGIPPGIQMRYARMTFDTQGQCSRAPAFKLRYETENAFLQWTDRVDFLPQRTQVVYFPILQEAGNRLTSIEFSGRGAACFQSLAEIDLPPSIFPGVYWVRSEEFLDRPWYRSPFEDGLGRLVTRAVEKYRDMACLAPSPVFTGITPPVNVTNEIRLGDVVEVRVDTATDNFTKDHVDLVDPRLIVGNTAISLLDLDIVRSNIPLSGLEYDSTIENNPLTIRGVEYAEGFGVHAPAMVRFSVPEDLRGKQARIEMLAGIDDETNGLGSATVTVCYGQ